MRTDRVAGQARQEVLKTIVDVVWMWCGCGMQPSATAHQHGDGLLLRVAFALGVVRVNELPVPLVPVSFPLVNFTSQFH